MPEPTSPEPFKRDIADIALAWLPRLAGAVVALIGLLVIVAWHAHWRTILEVLPNSPPMTYNTALCFLLTGVGLLLLSPKRAGLAALLGGAAAVFGLLTLSQYPLETSLGIDHLFYKPYFEIPTRFPGRMSPIVAFSFLLSGTAIVLASARVKWSHRLTGAGLLACFVGAGAGMALVGHTLGIESNYDWGAHTQFAVSSSAAFVVLSGGLMIWAWQRARLEDFNFFRWLPVTASVTLMLAVAFVSRTNMAQLRDATYQRKRSFQAIVTAQSFADNLTTLQRGAQAYVTTGDTNGLAAYASSAQIEPQQFNQLLALSKDNPAQTRRLQAVAAAMEPVLAREKSLVELRHQRASAVAPKMEGPRAVSALWAVARDRLREYAQEEKGSLNLRDSSEEADFNNAQRLLVLGSVLAAALLVLANSMASRELRQRLSIELQLRESEERFRSAFDGAPIGMALVSPTGRWLKVNRALSEMIGYSESEALTTDFQRFTHPDDLETDLALVAQTLAGNIPGYKMEKRYFHKNGAIVSVMLSVSLVRDPRGQPLYFVSQIENITERQRRDTERENLISELQAALARVKTLSGLIPICGWCKSIRSDHGYWQSVEQYVHAHTNATLSHGMCPDCARKFGATLPERNPAPLARPQS